MIELITERRSDVGNNCVNDDCSAKSIHFRIESDNVVRNGYKNDRVQEVRGKFSQHFANDVNVGAVHPVEMFSQEYRLFQSEYLEN
jgi:hypothetical protein